MLIRIYEFSLCGFRIADFDQIPTQSAPNIAYGFFIIFKKNIGFLIRIVIPKLPGSNRTNTRYPECFDRQKNKLNTITYLSY